MKRKAVVVFALVAFLFLLAFPVKTLAGGPRDYYADSLRVGEEIRDNDLLHMSGPTEIRYYEELYDYKADMHAVFSGGETYFGFWLFERPERDIHNWVVLVNTVVDGVREIELYSCVGDGVGGVRVSDLRGNEAVPSERWLDFSGTGAKTKTVRYFKAGEDEPFYTESTEFRYLHMGDRLDISPRGGISYPVAYWRVKNDPGNSGTLDLVAGKDVGMAEIVKTNEMYIGRIIPAGTLIDYAVTPYVSLHYFSSEFVYLHGKESATFNYSERKEGEEQWTVIGAGMDAPAFKVESCNSNHVHFSAVQSAMNIPDRTTVHNRDLLDGDVLYNGEILTFDTSYPCKIKYFTREREPIGETTTRDRNGAAIANPEGVNAGSWVVFFRDDEYVNLLALPFEPEAVVIPAEANRSLRYGGARVELGGKDYYYYDILSVAIADTRVNKAFSLTEILKNPGALTDSPDCDKTLLTRDVSNIGQFNKNGVGKGIVIDLNGHNASRISAGTVPEKETLVLTNSRKQRSYITGMDAFDDESGEGSCTGTVVMNGLNISTKIFPAMHTLYFLNGKYNLNSATVLEKHLENAVMRGKEGCPLYKFYEDYPYWTCRIEPEDDAASYPNGRKVVLNGQPFYYYRDVNTAQGEARPADTVMMCDGVNPRIDGTDPDPGNIGIGTGSESQGKTDAETDVQQGEQNAPKVLLILACIAAALLLAAAVLLILKKKKAK